MQPNAYPPAINLLFGNPGVYDVRLKVNFKIQTTYSGFNQQQPALGMQQQQQRYYPAIGQHTYGCFGSGGGSQQENFYNQGSNTFEDSVSSNQSLQGGALSESWCYQSYTPQQYNRYPYTVTDPTRPRCTNGQEFFQNNMHGGGLFGCGSSGSSSGGYGGRSSSSSSSPIPRGCFPMTNKCNII